jgi:hypothetical protein
MSYSEIDSTILQRVASEVALAESIEIQYPNGPKVDNSALAIYGTVTVKEVTAKTVEIGATRFRTDGILCISLFAKEQTGTERILEVAETVKLAFRQVTVSPVRFTTPRREIVGFENNKKWYQVLILCPFYVMESNV